MFNPERNPLREPLAIFLVALSMSIGWGMRGNFGHEAGTMIPGVLGAIAIAIMSRREDWQSRIPHVALLGGLGWGFGGSISYMYPISFTMSGHFDTMFYGFLATFLEGGLWCAMGTAGAALAMTANSARLAGLYKPLLFVLAAMFVQHLVDSPLAHALSVDEGSRMDETWHRQESPLYWFDADWLPALFAFFGVCAYEFVGHNLRRMWVLPAVTILGAIAGGLAQLMMSLAGILEPFVDFVVVPQGDLNYVNPETGQRFDPENLMTNWPQFFGDYSQHVGWLVGGLIAFTAYFLVIGKWRNDSGLFVALSLGWLGGFLAMPVFGSIFLADYGGFRMTPPRSDDWAGIVGAFTASMIWCYRRDLRAVTLAGSLAFLLGGFGFATGHVLRTIPRWPGHPHRLPNGTPEFWKHYQDVNWHSVMEQTQGFCLGIAMVLALSVVWGSHAPRKSAALPTWTTIFATVFVMFGILHMNVFKNVEKWTEGDRPLVSDPMKAPFFGFIELSAASWFEIVWWAAAAACLFALVVHTRRPLALMPESAAGRGQLLYVFVLWVMVIANFERALPAFPQARLVTEWVIFMNACLATAILVTRFTAPFHEATIPLHGPPRIRLLWIRGLAAAFVTMFAYTVLFKAMYGDAAIEHPIYAHKRFGPEALWRIEPILKHGEHR
jgi:hypothetical protein